MPLPSNPETVDVGAQLVDILHKVFGPQPGFRPAHAKGLLIKGTFIPTPDASTLSIAQHFQQETPILARFSNATGFPQIPDTDPNANPRGLAIRFILAESPRQLHTDIITHSTPFFPAKDGPDAVSFFTALVNGSIKEHLSTHTAAREFIQAPKPLPRSLSSEQFFGINAFKFVDRDGGETFIRYRIIPREGVLYLTPEEVEGLDSNYLFDSVAGILGQGPVFDIVVQIAEEGDVTDDCTIRWPETRKLVKIGSISFDRVMDDNAAEQKKIIFDPVPRVVGIEPSDDPLIDVRAALYLISGRERRAA